MWYEVHDEIGSAIVREKQIKERKRLWKLELIEKSNPTWKDLYSEIVYKKPLFYTEISLIYNIHIK